MRIKIINFKVQQVFKMTEDVWFFTKIIRWLLGPPLETEFHFDLLMKINEDYINNARQLEPGDLVDLPNKVRLKIWSVDRHGIVKAKTIKMIKTDLRDYHPIEMYLVYDKVHGRI